MKPTAKPNRETFLAAAEEAGRADYLAGDVSYVEGAARWAYKGSTAAYQRGWNSARGQG